MTTHLYKLLREYKIQAENYRKDALDPEYAGFAVVFTRLAKKFEATVRIIERQNRALMEYEHISAQDDNAVTRYSEAAEALADVEKIAGEG